MQRAVRFIFYLTSLEVKKKNIKPEKGIPHLNIGSDIFSQQVQENAYIWSGSDRIGDRIGQNTSYNGCVSQNKEQIAAKHATKVGCLRRFWLCQTR